MITRWPRGPGKIALCCLGAILALALFSCSYPGDSESDKALAKQLVGTWISEHPGTFAFYSEKTCHRDGTATGFILDKNDDGSTQRVTFKSVWRVKNGCVVGKVLESDDPHDFLKAGDEFTDKIISITKTEFVFLTEDGSREVRKRKQSRFQLF